MVNTRSKAQKLPKKTLARRSEPPSPPEGCPPEDSCSPTLSSSDSDNAYERGESIQDVFGPNRYFHLMGEKQNAAARFWNAKSLSEAMEKEEAAQIRRAEVKKKLRDIEESLRLCKKELEYVRSTHHEVKKRIKKLKAEAEELEKFIASCEKIDAKRARKIQKYHNPNDWPSLGPVPDDAIAIIVRVANPTGRFLLRGATKRMCKFVDQFVQQQPSPFPEHPGLYSFVIFCRIRARIGRTPVTRERCVAAWEKGVGLTKEEHDWFVELDKGVTLRMMLLPPWWTEKEFAGTFYEKYGNYEFAIPIIPEPLVPHCVRPSVCSKSVIQATLKKKSATRRLFQKIYAAMPVLANNPQ